MASVARAVLYDILSLNDPFIKVMHKDPSMDIISGQLHQGKNVSFGVNTGGGKHGQGNVKESVIMALKDAVVKNQIRFCSEFIIRAPKMSTNEYKTILMNQMKAMSKKFKPISSTFQTPTYKYDGKHAGPDDSCMVLALMIYWSLVFVNRSQ
jgi:hypothetical protein